MEKIVTALMRINAACVSGLMKMSDDVVEDHDIGHDADGNDLLGPFAVFD